MMLWKRHKKSCDEMSTSNEMESKSIANPNEVTATVEIPTYAPHQGIVPREYQISPEMAELEASFGNLCLESLEKLNSDVWNSTYMDATIERICVEAITYLRVQRTDHILSITKLLDDMHRGDRIKAEAKLVNHKEEKESVEAKLRKYRRVYHYGTCFAEEGEGNRNEKKA